MKNLTNFFSCACLSIVLSLCLAANSSAQNSQKVPAEVQAIAGTYTGSWTIYGINEKGEIFRQAAWTDTMKAENPSVEANRAFVTTLDAVTFEGGNIPPLNFVGKEGYLLNKDGSLGDYFIEINGQTFLPKKLDKDSWSYAVPVNPRDFAALGDKFIGGAHVMVKTVIFEQGIETHYVSRLTTVRWKGADGKERATQFISLQGQHKRSAK